MSQYLNSISLIGRVGKKPEISQTNNGQKIAKFSIATSETWTAKDSNEKKERTDWHSVVVYNGKLAEIIEKYIDAGSLIFIEGKMRYEKWTDPQGTERKLSQVVLDLGGKFVMLDSKKSGEVAAATSSTDFGSDDIPF